MKKRILSVLPGMHLLWLQEDIKKSRTTGLQHTDAFRFQLIPITNTGKWKERTRH
jgi:hypothetical protein